MYNEGLLKNEEKAIFALRDLYKLYGYLPFKMSKFEEYDLYVRNKDFLLGDSVITFNDTDGKLLALKPDVTLSIIKNTVDEQGCKQKVYYNENVYRVSGSTHRFKEIMQTGLECIGDIDLIDVFEVVYLAAKSLDSVSSDFALDISHMGIFSRVVDDASESKSFKNEIAKLISEKNRHEAELLCKKYGIDSEKAERILCFTNLYGSMQSVIERLIPICSAVDALDELRELEKLSALISKTEFADRIKLDFSVLNSMKYYNGIVFKGFLNGICESVLSGGEYGSLMRKMGRSSNAIGFALYLDLLESLEVNKKEYDVDVMLLYDEKTSAEKIFLMRDKLISESKSVSMQRAIPKKLRYNELIDLRGDFND